ncbi:hypothetical protein ILYODFUR_029335, partial [Ilyodon furcidens]
MHVVLLITLMCGYALLLAVGEEDFYNDRPCQRSNNQNAYKNFERNHILPSNFQTDLRSAWQRHVKELGRCRVATQTFISQSNAHLVVSICNGKGWNQQGNLCTSNSKIPVFLVKVKTSDCTVQN